MPRTVLDSQLAKSGYCCKARFLKQTHRSVIDKAKDFADLPVRGM
jgi:hypothetical protein